MAIALAVIMVVGALPMTSILTSNASAASMVYEDDFDSPGMTGWTMSGLIARQDCTLSSNPGGCSLNVSAQSSSSPATASRSVSVPFGSVPLSLSFFFRAENAAQFSTSWAVIDLANSPSIRVDLGENASHLGVKASVGSNATSAFFTTPAKTWFQARVRIDPATSAMNVEIRDITQKNILATSPTLSLPPSASAFTGITFGGSYSGGNPVTQPASAWNFDALTIAIATAPAAPIAVATGGPGAGQATITWSAPSDDGGAPITKYTIYGRNATGNESAIAEVGSAVRSFVEQGNPNGHWRYYRVTAWNAVGEGVPSQNASARTFTTPGAPQNVIATTGSDVGKINLQWTAPADKGGAGATLSGYVVYRGTDPVNLVEIARPSSATSNLVDSNRQNGTRYHYAVSALNVVGEGDRSSIANATGKPDTSFAATAIVLQPSTGWTGDPRTITFNYDVQASECAPPQSCPVAHDWRVIQDGTPSGPDGTLLAAGQNIHNGHAGRTTFSVNTTVSPSGDDGTHRIKVLVNARANSTQWSSSNTTTGIDAPLPSAIYGPSTPTLAPNNTKGTELVRIRANYSVLQKQCAQYAACSVANEWMILLDGSSPYRPDGQILAQGSNVHPAHGSTDTYSIDRTVWIPRLADGPHFIKIAARADAASPWKVAFTPTSGVIFQPQFDDPAFASNAGQGAYATSQAGHARVWALGVIAAAAGHSGVNAWATNLVGNYPPLADGKLSIGPIDLVGTSTATLSFATKFDTADNFDAAQVLLRNGGSTVLLEPVSGPAYVQLIDGERGWAGTSNGWQTATFDLTAYVGSTVTVELRFRSDAIAEAPGWQVDDITISTQTANLQDSFEAAWPKTGSWTLGQPTTGPGRGDSSLNAWSVAPYAPYGPNSANALYLPRFSLEGFKAVSMSFRHWFQTEYGGDLARVEASRDGGKTWEPLHPSDGRLYDRLPSTEYGWSGNSLGWTTSTFELTPYIGSTLDLRFVFRSDDIYHGAGWYLSDLSVIGQAMPPTPAPAFDTYTGATSAFYAYFQGAGKTASVTAPDGRTTTITYRGTGDVVAKLAANGVLTARQALVGIYGPVVVPASEFTVTGPGFADAYSAGTWTVRPAAGTVGYGGTQLVVGRKTFDDVASGSEPIDGNGMGSLSASNAPVLSWNWHNQLTARHDASVTSSQLPVQTALDKRLRYELDNDGDGFSDKTELRANSDPLSPSSTPEGDDDGDGIPNIIEESRDAALDSFSRTLRTAGRGLAVNSAWSHEAATRRSFAHLEGATLPDYDNDGITDLADLVNDPDGALITVGENALSNHLSLTTARSGFQVVVLISPSWKDVVLLEIGAPGPEVLGAPLTYDEFFARLDAYHAANPWNTAGEVDQLLNVVLKQVLDGSMNFKLVRRAVATGVTSTIPLSFLAGVGGDGTWTIARDTDIVGLVLTIEGRAISASLPATPLTMSGRTVPLPNLGIAHVSWYFVNVHNFAYGYQDITSCVSYNAFIREGACATFPTTDGMRFYSPEGELATRSLVRQLRTLYYRASLVPEALAFANAFANENGVETSNGEWQTSAPQITVGVGTILQVAEGNLATADFGSASPRQFTWELVFTPPPKFEHAQPSAAIGLEPVGGSHDGSVVVVHGSVLAALGFDVSRDLPIGFDAEHQGAMRYERKDVDGDGLMDYVVTVDHFSKAWILVSQFNGPTQGDFDIWSATRAFLTLGYPNTFVWRGPGVCQTMQSGCYNGWNLVNPVPGQLNTYDDRFLATAVSVAGENEGWYSGGNDCNGSTRYQSWVLRLEFNSNAGSPAQGHDGWGYFSTWTPWTWSTGSCTQFRDIHALSSSNVWVAGDLGVKRWNGWSWDHYSSQAMSHLEFVDTTTGYAVGKGTGQLYRWVGSSWDRVWGADLPFTPTDRPSAFGVNDGKTILFATSSSQVAYCPLPCASWTLAAAPPGVHSAQAIWAHDANDMWSVGSDGCGSLYRKSTAGWTRENSNWNLECTGPFEAIDFKGRNEGWMIENNGKIYHYTGTNTPPTASFSAPSSTTTSAAIQVDASGSSDFDKDPITYTWNWGDGTATASGVSATHRYSAAGTFTITLTVTDNEGATGTTTRNVAVSRYALTPGTPLVQTMAGSGQQDYYVVSVPSGKDQLVLSLTGAGGTNFDLYTKFNADPTTSSNDGSSTQSGSTESIVKTSPSTGTWHIMVRSQSGSGSYTLTATLLAKPSVPSATQTPSPQLTGNAFTLSGSSTGDSPLFYLVKWGDGTSDTRVPASGTLSSGATYSTTHAFSNVGDFTIRVDVTDQAGLTNTRSITGSARNMPSGATNLPTAVGQTTATLSGTLSSLGGYSNADTWFEYGPTTSYGSTTPVVTRTTGTFTVAISGLQPETDYHYRLVMRNAMGTQPAGDRMLHTVNLAPGAPSMTRHAQVTAPGETLWVTGSGTDPESDPIHFIITWGDGTTTRYPTSGTVPSGSSYNVSRGYTATGTYNIQVQSHDVYAFASPVTSQPHTVVALPAGITRAVSDIQRTSATLNADITSVGGDSNGVLGWFQYGRTSQGFTHTSPPMVYTSPRSVAFTATGLTEGGDYQSRFVVSNARGQVNGATVFFATNAKPTLQVLDLVPPEMFTGGDVSFVVRYTDVQNEAPGAGYPRVIINGVPTVLTQPTPDNNFVDGAIYSLSLELAPGKYTYSYQWTDSLPDVQTVAGRTPAITVFKPVTWYDGISHAPNANGLPSQQWTVSGGSTSGAKWQTINTPATSAHAYAPDAMFSQSVSLWFGDASTGKYSNGVGTPSRGSVITPTIDLTTVGAPALTFWTYYETEDNGTRWDTKKVYAINAAGQETHLATLSGPQNGMGRWWPVSLSLTDFQRQSIRIRFEFDTVDGTANDYSGWFINELTVGSDRDEDNIPDVVEAQVRMNTLWTSTDGRGTILPGQDLTGHLWGVQSSFTEQLTSVVKVTGSPCSTRLILNTSDWSSTVLSGACPATIPSHSRVTLEGGITVIRTNLLAAGYPAWRMDRPENITMKVRANGQAIAVREFTVMTTGHTMAMIADSDGDGVEDGYEMNTMGSLPLSRDPDNDQYFDGYDTRPFTPDDPPVISLLDPGEGTWGTSLRAKVYSRHSEPEVRMWFTGASGTRELLPTSKPDAFTWEWTFPTDLGQVKSARVSANDSHLNNMQMEVTYNTAATAVSTAKADFRVFNDVGVGLLVVTAGAPIAVQAGATALGVALAPEVALVGVVVGILAVGYAVLAIDFVEKTPTQVNRLERGVRYPPTGVVRSYNLNEYPGAAGKLNCINTIHLFNGVSGTYTSRGARAMVDAYPLSLHPADGYASTTQVGSRIANALQSGTAVVGQIDPHTGVILWVDAATSILYRWHIQLNTITCAGEIVNERRHRVDDAQVTRDILLLGGTASLMGLLYKITEKGPKQKRYNEAFIHFIDAKASYAEVELVNTKAMTGEALAHVLRHLCHIPALDGSIPPDCTWETRTESKGSYAIEVAELSMAAGRAQAQKNGTSFKPAWYWWNATRDDRGANPFARSQVLDKNAGVFILDDPSGAANAYNDMLSSRGLSSLRLAFSNPSTFSMLRESEQKICERSAAEVNGRFAFAPIVFTKTSPRHIYVELADSRSGLGYGGGC